MVSGHSSWKQAARTTTRNQSLKAQCSRSSKSYYVDDTAFILLSRGEVIAASKLIVSHFRRFGLTIHTGSRRKGEDSNGGHSLQAWSLDEISGCFLVFMGTDGGVE
jgi:hypothetical protein